jgi:RNA polymerase sigma-70 factor (ECF subfamily)
MDSHFASLADEALMALVLQKDQAAFAELVTRHSSRFYALAYRTLFDKVAAEDAVQEAFVKLWRQPQQWRGDEQAVKFTTWFYRVVVNLCLDINKKKTPFALADGFDVEDDDSNIETQLQQQQQQSLLDSAIAGLPEHQRTAINLCFYEKLSNQQAAEVMGLSLKALQSLLIRAKTALKQRVNFSAGGGH